MRIITSAAALAFLVATSVVDAAGLGKLSVNSSLGQILNAEIDLVSVQPGEIDAISARVASPEAYRDARIEYSGALRLLRFTVEKRPNGQPYLKVSSVAPINEPFVDMLVEVTWPAGRIQREYPILLDPPGYAQKTAPPSVSAAPASRTPETAPPASAPAASSTQPATTAPAESAGGPSASAELAATPPGASPETAASGDTYGPVQRGDTLRKIAEEAKPADVSLEQMLVALYRENKGAFVNNNMNRLKTGQILKIPAADEVGKITKGAAGREIRTHVADWKAYREQLASGVATAPGRGAESAQAASGRVGTAAVTPPAPPASEPKDVLKISKSEGAKAGPGGAGSPQARITALQEELTAKDKALREAQSRVTDLEGQIRDMQRLMDLKAGTAGKADAKVAAVPPPPVAATKPAEPPKTEAPKPEPAKPAEPPKTDTKLADAGKAPEPAKPAEPPKADAAKPGEPPKADAPATKVAEAPKTDAPKPAAPKKAPPPPPKSFTDELLDNPWYLAAGGGILALGLAGFLFMRRRREAAVATSEYPAVGVATSGFPSDLKGGPSTGKPAAGLVDTGNSSFLTDFDKTGPGTIDTDEVDPVAEAEVYIAYGRDAQAEEILKEAMARDRNRHEIALKLLEIYHARKSATAFETVAKELRGAVGESHPLWQKAAAMGAQIDPNNPLYTGAAAAGAAAFTSSAPAAPAAPPKPDLDFDLDTSSSAAAPAPSFDLDLGRKPGAPAHEPALDFDIDAGGKAPAVDVPLESTKEEKPAFDFDLSGLDMPSTKSAPAPDLDLGGKPSVELADLSLDSPGESAGGGEAVGTKLELAKAYLEIGDKDGAREILQEVAKEGSSTQKAEAQKLIASL